MTDVRVEIRGLRELSGAFRLVDANIGRELQAKFKDIASRVVQRAAGQVPHQTGAAAGSLVPRASSRGAAIAFGGQRAPYYPWLDFGGRVGRHKSIYRDLVNGGRYLYPTISSMNSEIEQAAGDAVADAARQAGFEVRG